MKLPDYIGIMCLQNLVFFPHNMLPLYIFEPRYREMLEQALAADRMFAVCRSQPGTDEPYEVGTVGVIRACVENPDGTSQLILQGFQRVRFAEFSQTTPLHIGRPEPLCTAEIPSKKSVKCAKLAKHLVQLACSHPDLPDTDIPALKRFMSDMQDYQMLVDIIAGNFLQNADLKQELLEIEEVESRMLSLVRILECDVKRSNMAG